MLCLDWMYHFFFFGGGGGGLIDAETRGKGQAFSIDFKNIASVLPTQPFSSLCKRGLVSNALPTGTGARQNSDSELPTILENAYISLNSPAIPEQWGWVWVDWA